MSWAFTEEKIARQIADVQAAAVRERLPLGPIRVRVGALVEADAAHPDADDSGWAVLGADRTWGAEREVTAWLRTRVEVPFYWAGDTAVVHVEPFDAEILVYVDGVARQAFDAAHHELMLGDAAGQSFLLAMEAYSGVFLPTTNHNALATDGAEHRLVVAELRRVDEEMRGLARDMRFALESAQGMASAERRRAAVIEALDEATNRLDFRAGTNSDVFRASARAARQGLRSALARIDFDPTVPTLWATGHAHIDTAWLWRLVHTRRKCARTFANVLDLMARYPEFHFTCSQPSQYAMVKEDHPALYEEIRRAVDEGRWETVGGMWVEADCNVTGGESLVRQFLYGQRFFEREFGTRTEVVWLPDVFGYSAAFPQIIRKAGMKYFMTIKIFWSQVNKPPYQTFKWVGIDGTDVLVHFSPNGNYNSQVSPAVFKALWEGYRQPHLTDSALLIYGFGDGGGGPTREMIENALRASEFPLGPRVKMSTSQAFFEDLEGQVGNDPRLPVWNGELYLEYHRGTYTTHADVKKGNRQSEILYQSAEIAACLAMVLARVEYPQAALTEGWLTILLNQFHDILPGSSIEAVYRDAADDYARVRHAGERVLEASVAGLGSGVVALNPLPWVRRDPFKVPGHWGVVGQAIEDFEGHRETLVSFEVPAVGVATVMEAALGVSDLVVEERLLENQFFRLILDECGEIASLWDKRHDREVLDLRAYCRGNALLAFEDRPMAWDAWDVDIFYQDKMYPWREMASLHVVERGPLRAGVEIRRVMAAGRQSEIRQRILLHRDVPRIDFQNRVDWRERQTLLKVAFPVAVNALRATYDIQFGNVERPTHWNTSWDWARFEVCAHKWADLSEGDYGVSLLSDCKYGWDIRGNVMRLTLLKGSVSPDPVADLGVHAFTYSLLPHAGDWRAGETVRHAYELNVPVRVAQGTGDASVRFSLFEVDAPNVILETVKKAEDGDALIVRLYEAYNQRGTATLRCGLPIASARRVNLMESDPDGEDPLLAESALRFEYRPYEIITL
ncbi:MAG: alpha-mannosidase, partial [Armatimonadetes bacterium]|nr:alpha-mannosidase [Armatimonadota bacterium]